MTDVHDEIRDWLYQQQDWLQEAAERILTAGGLDLDEVVRTVVGRVKTSEGQNVTNTRSFVGLGISPDPEANVRLVDVGSISGIENLGPRSPLNFGDGNLAVIYGTNGSGKSGFARILKRACGKPRAKDLRSNVFEPSPPNRQCTITYKKGDVKHPTKWDADGAPIEALRTIDVFDADTADFYFTQEAAASYAPPAVTFLEVLANLINQVSKKLGEEQNGLVSALPTLPPALAATETGKVYAALRPDLSEESLARLTRWTEDDEKNLNEIVARLNAADSAELARKQRSTKARLEHIATQIAEAVRVVGSEGLEEVRRLRSTAQSKRQIAIEAARVGSQLDGVGTEAWNALWDAARAYSKQVYQDRDFPVTEAGSLCVLCQQELKEAAPARLLRFEAFVQNEIEGEARKAEEAYRSALHGLPIVPSGEDIRTQCEAGGLSDESWPSRLTAFWNGVDEVCRLIERGETDRTAAGVAVPATILEELRSLSETLERAAKQNDEDAKSFDREQTSNAKLDLEARRWTAQQADAIRLEIERLKQIENYKSWRSLANSRSASLKADEVAERLITQVFVDRFNYELRLLGASRIRVELVKTRTERGVSLHRLRLKGAQSGQELPALVLSEGERRIVSLAAFLADVADKPNCAPFILDDPVSSLDQDFESHVARRLVDLAQNRQVLIFTHRLSLCGAIDDSAKKIPDSWADRNMKQCWIESFAGISGHPSDQHAWIGNTKTANNGLIDRLDRARKAGDAEGPDAYRTHAQAICSDFRKLLERTVEDDLLNSVVKRHRRSVTTDNRIELLSKITRPDCVLLDDLMTKYSCFEHSQSNEDPVFLPGEAELRADLERLRDWRNEFKTRSVEAPS